MLREPISRPSYLGWGVAALLCLIALYSYLSARQHAKNPDDRSMPRWSEFYHEGLVKVFTSTDTATGDKWIWADLKATYYRLFSGLGLACLFSVILGVLMGCYAPIEAFFLPSLAFLAKIPATAIMVVFFVTVGTEELMYTSMIGFGLFPTLAPTVFHAAREDVPEELLFKARTLGASQFSCIWDVIVKHIFPKILEAVRLQIGPAVVYLIAAEMLVGHSGFGYRLKLYWRINDMSVVFVYCMVLGVVGLILDRALIVIQRQLCPWYSPH